MAKILPLLRKSFHILLAILVFVSSSGLVFSKHYCRGELKRVALFTEAASCHASAQKKTCPRHRAPAKAAAVSKNNCCATVTDFLKNAEEQLSSTVELPFTSAPITFLFPADLFILPMLTATFQPADYQHYKPPLLVHDLSVRLQTFRC